MGSPLCYVVMLLLSSLLFTPSTALSSMAIDLGSDSMKIAVVLPKVPMEVGLDGHAQRKTPIAVGFRDGERLFGANAINVASMRPAYVYESISSIIGKHIDHPTVQLYKQRYPYHNLTYDELTGQLIFHHPEGMSFTVEELLAMLLEYARDIAEGHSEATIKTCVLTVPSFYGLSERESLIRAVRIAGLELQQLINVNTAVALDFGISRRKSFNESSQFFMFFDVGYTSTTATVVSYHVGKHHQGGVSAQDPILTILGVGSAPNLGTSSLIYRIRDYFAESFSESTAIPLSTVRENARVMSRISREAVRVLNVLSANTEADVQIEQLLNDKDFRLHFTREKMETLCKMEFDAFSKPFFDALTGSGVDLSVIQDIVLMGGGTRIPKVREILMSLGKRSDLGKGLNSDEAAVMGAIYQAAFHTPGFRVLPFVVKDYNVYPIAVDFKRAPQSGPADEKSETGDFNTDIRRVLFPRGNPFPQKRAITFNRHTTDLTFYVNYADLRDEDIAYLRMINLTRATTKGAAKAVEKYPGSELRGIKAHFNLDYSGVLTLTGVDCLFQPLTPLPSPEEADKDESTFQKLGSTISGFFGVGGNKKGKENELNSDSTANTDAGAESGENSTQPQNGTAVNGTTTSNGTTINVTNTTETKDSTERKSQIQSNITKDLKPFTERIDFNLEVLHAPVPSESYIEQSIKKLRDLRNADRARQELEKMANELESSIFTMRQNIESDMYVVHSTQDERQRLSIMLTDSLEWFEEQDKKTPREVYEEKLLELRRVYLPIHSRVTEAQKRPIAFEELNKTIALAQTTLTRMSEINDVLYKLHRSMQGQKLKQQQEQEKQQPPADQIPLNESSENPNISVHPPVTPSPSPTDDATVPESSPSESQESKSQPIPTEEQKAGPAFVPLFPDADLESLKKLTNELMNWMDESVKRLNEVAPHQAPPVRVEEIQDKQGLLKSKLTPHHTKLSLFQSEMERAHQQQQKQKQKPAKSEKKKSTTEQSKTMEPLPEATVESIPQESSSKAPEEKIHLEL